MFVVLAMIIYVYFRSDCEQKPCDNVLDAMTYKDSVQSLREYVQRNPNSKDQLLNAFFNELETSCPAAAKKDEKKEQEEEEEKKQN
jgi:hypothetical protein